MLAEIALGRRHVRIRDIPEHLLDDGATSERIAWLAEKGLNPTWVVRRERRVFLAGANPAQQLSLRLIVAAANHGGNNMV